MSPLELAAIQARERAHAPYSGFRVGAALEDRHGLIFTGCNIEDSSYGLSMCAERVAIFKAVSEGAGEPARMVVVADTPYPTPPCGACRQLLWDFCRRAEIILINMDGKREVFSVAALLPNAFDATFI